MDLNALYQQLLGRAPDSGAAGFYGGMTEDAVRRAIIASPEYYGRVSAMPVAAPTPSPSTPATGGMTGQPGYPGTTPGVGTGTGMGSVPGQANPYDAQMQSLLQMLQQQQQTLNGFQTGWSNFQTDFAKGMQNFGQASPYGGIFGNQTSPTYSPQSRNGYGSSWGGSNPFMKYSSF